MPGRIQAGHRAQRHGVRERVYALLCRSYADELSPLTDASIRDNATMLLKELKTKDAGR